MPLPQRQHLSSRDADLGPGSTPAGPAAGPAPGRRPPTRLYANLQPRPATRDRHHDLGPTLGPDDRCALAAPPEPTPTVETLRPSPAEPAICTADPELFTTAFGPPGRSEPDVMSTAIDFGEVAIGTAPAVAHTTIRLGAALASATIDSIAAVDAVGAASFVALDLPRGRRISPGQSVRLPIRFAAQTPGLIERELRITGTARPSNGPVRPIAATVRVRASVHDPEKVQSNLQTILGGIHIISNVSELATELHAARRGQQATAAPDRRAPEGPSRSVTTAPRSTTTSSGRGPRMNDAERAGGRGRAPSPATGLRFGGASMDSREALTFVGASMSATLVKQLEGLDRLRQDLDVSDPPSLSRKLLESAVEVGATMVIAGVAARVAAKVTARFATHAAQSVSTGDAQSTKAAQETGKMVGDVFKEGFKTTLKKALSNCFGALANEGHDHRSYLRTYADTLMHANDIALAEHFATMTEILDHPEAGLIAAAMAEAQLELGKAVADWQYAHALAQWTTALRKGADHPTQGAGLLTLVIAPDRVRVEEWPGVTRRVMAELTQRMGGRPLRSLSPSLRVIARDASTAVPTVFVKNWHEQGVQFAPGDPMSKPALARRVGYTDGDSDGIDRAAQLAARGLIANLLAMSIETAFQE